MELSKNDHTANSTYRLATLNNDKQLLEKISSLEVELSKNIGQKIVLIAYTK